MKPKSTTAPTFTFKRILTSSVMTASAVLLAFSAPMGAYADSFDDQIRALENEISAYQSQSAQLAAQANTLQNALNRIVAQKGAIQAQINLSQAKYDQLTADIAANEVKLAKQKDLLSVTLTQLYVNGKQSPIEVLASSESLGDYIDQQEYRSTVRDKVLSAMKQVKELKEELSRQKIETERVLKDLEGQRAQLAAQEAEQARLLEQTRGEEAAYQSLISSKKAAIEELYEQQRQSMLSVGGQIIAGDPNRGGYPSEYANPPLDSVVDPWGMYNRECVSYTAWKVYQKNGYMPYWGGVGNARQWPGNADNAGIPRGSAPKVGSVAIIYNVYAGDQYGHSAWVESIQGGDVIVSQYNWGTPGSYTEMRVPASYFDTYIYF